jgi:DNA modification methylase
LRDYGEKGQLGLEATPQDYVDRMVVIFAEVRRVLKDSGTLWLNLGDSYAGSWGNYGGKNRGAGDQRIIRNGSQVRQRAYDELKTWRPPTSGKLGPGIKNKDLVGIPWMVAFALRADGWYLRQDIVWNKPNPMPESMDDRCTKAHEYIFLLPKSERYYYDQDAIREPLQPSSVQRFSQDISGQVGSTRAADAGRNERTMKAVFKKLPDGQANIREYRDAVRAGEIEETMGANKRSVWTIATVPFKDAHFATFPEKLVAPMILAGCPKGGIVLDPFMGSGTTAAVALKAGRGYVGIELNPKYQKMAQARVRGLNPML